MQCLEGQLRELVDAIAVAFARHPVDAEEFEGDRVVDPHHLRTLREQLAILLVRSPQLTFDGIAYPLTGIERLNHGGERVTYAGQTGQLGAHAGGGAPVAGGCTSRRRRQRRERPHQE